MQAKLLQLAIHAGSVQWSDACCHSGTDIHTRSYTVCKAVLPTSTDSIRILVVCTDIRKLCSIIRKSVRVVNYVWYYTCRNGRHT